MGCHCLRTSAQRERSADEGKLLVHRHPASGCHRDLLLHFHLDLRVLPACKAQVPLALDQGRRGTWVRLDGRRARDAVFHRQLLTELRSFVESQDQPHIASQDGQSSDEAQVKEG